MSNNTAPYLIRVLFGNKETSSLEKRVLNAAIFSSCIIATFIVFESFALNFSLGTLTLALVVATAFWLLFAFSRPIKTRNWPMWTYISLVGLTILADWFLVGGQAGFARPVFVAIAGFVPLITQRGQFKLGIFLIFSIYATMVVGSVFFWHSIPWEEPTKQSTFEQLCEAGILSIGVLIVAYLAVHSYRREKNNAAELNDSLILLNKSLEQKNYELQRALKEVKTLRGILPTCSYCKKIRPQEVGQKENKSWVPIETYISNNSEAQFSHGMCPDCMKEKFGEDALRDFFES